MTSAELHGIGLRRGEGWLVRDVTWSIPAGSCVAILGPNGSGKSTLARILAGHLWPTAGRLVLLGDELGHGANLPQLRRDIRLIQPAGPFDVDPELSAVEVVLTGYFGTIGLYDAITDSLRNEAEQLLSAVGLSHVASHRYSTLSSGERVRALIARALIVRPKLLLLDEPTAGLDLLAREQVLGVVQQMFESTDIPPPATIFITHHVEELPPATSDVLLMDHGRVAARGKPAEVLRGEVLSRVYGCPVEVRTVGGRYYAEVHPAAWKELLKLRV